MSLADILSVRAWDKAQKALYHSSGFCSLKPFFSIVWITWLPVKNGSPSSRTATAFTAVVPMSKVATNIILPPKLILSGPYLLDHNRQDNDTAGNDVLHKAWHLQNGQTVG